MSERLVVRPWTVKREAGLAFNGRVHRRLPDVQGAMWCVSVRKGDRIVGTALVGWPSRRQTNDEIDTLSVLRVAVEEGIDGPTSGGKKHANSICSMLYGACWRAARAMGATSMVTYTHLDESGKSLIASGWIDGGLTDGGEWDRDGRPRQKVIDSERKRRWWAPGSLRRPPTNQEPNES